MQKSLGKRMLLVLDEHLQISSSMNFANDVSMKMNPTLDLYGKKSPSGQIAQIL